MIIKYLVEKSFRDKNTKKNIMASSVIDVDIARMKELNEKKAGRVVDIILDNQETNVNDIENKEPEQEIQENIDNDKVDSIKLYTEEQLKEKTVNELKEIAEGIGLELTQAKKDDIIEEILKFSEK